MMIELVFVLLEKEWMQRQMKLLDLISFLLCKGDFFLIVPFSIFFKSVYWGSIEERCSMV